jgi:uncharacterized membrane protein
MLRQCCCGCTLKTGTIIIGVLNIIGGAGNLILGITSATAASQYISDPEIRNVVIGTGATLAVFGAILLLFSICLIIGAQNEKPALLVPWMVYTIIFLIVNTIIYIVQAVQLFRANDASNGAVNIVAATLFVLLQTYFLLVVYSLYREQKGTAPTSSV